MAGSRGLAVADQETRKRVATMGGKSHSREYFVELGRKGGKAPHKNRPTK